MRYLTKTLGILALILPMAGSAFAGDDVYVTSTSDQTFDDAAAAVESQIINRGYTIDYRGYIGDMLKRTAGDVGATKKLYKDAEFFTFCSAVLSREVMEEDIADIAYCPYSVFVYETEDAPGTVTVGFRKLPEGGKRDEVNKLLRDIADGAAEGF